MEKFNLPKIFKVGKYIKREQMGSEKLKAAEQTSDHENSARGSRKSAIFSSNVGEEQDIREFFL